MRVLLLALLVFCFASCLILYESTVKTSNDTVNVEIIVRFDGIILYRVSWIGCSPIYVAAYEDRITTQYNTGGNAPLDVMAATLSK